MTPIAAPTPNVPPVLRFRSLVRSPPLPVSLPRPRRDVPKEVVGTTEGLIDK